MEKREQSPSRLARSSTLRHIPRSLRRQPVLHTLLCILLTASYTQNHKKHTIVCRFIVFILSLLSNERILYTKHKRKILGKGIWLYFAPPSPRPWLISGESRF